MGRPNSTSAIHQVCQLVSLPCLPGGIGLHKNPNPFPWETISFGIKMLSLKYNIQAVSNLAVTLDNVAILGILILSCPVSSMNATAC